MPALLDVYYTTGTRGCGKTARRAADFVLHEWLPDHEGVHLSNFPWRFDDWQEPERDELGNERLDASGNVIYKPEIQPGLCTIAKQEMGMEPEEVKRRVQVIPKEELDLWRVGKSGPWAYFAGKNLSGYHIAIDEIHNFCPAKGAGRKLKGTDKTWEQHWQEWIGESRHLGCTVEFISQSPLKVAKIIEAECSAKIKLSSSKTRPDFYFGIILYDWYQVIAKFTGIYSISVWEQTWRDELEKWVCVEEHKFRLNPKYFTVYDSYSKPHAGGIAGKTERPEYQRFSTGRLIAWFLKRNGTKLLWGKCGGLLVWPILAYLILFGGTKQVGAMFFASIQKGMQRAVPTGEKTESQPKAVLKQTPYAKAIEARGKLRAESGQGRGSSEKSLEPIAAGTESAVLPDAAEFDRLSQDWKLGVILPNAIVFCGGYRYEVNEAIIDGPLVGSIVKAIDYRGRYAQIDGIRIRLGDAVPADRVLSFMQKQRGGVYSQKLEPRSGVQKPLSEPSAASPGSARGTVPGKADHDISGGYAVDGVFEAAGN